MVIMATVNISSICLKMFSPFHLLFHDYHRNLDVVVVRKEVAAQSHHHFCVRRSVIHRALLWLITNNKYYRATKYILMKIYLPHFLKMAISQMMCQKWSNILLQVTLRCLLFKRVIQIIPTFQAHLFLLVFHI